jgi:hypothetical protein
MNWGTKIFLTLAIFVIGMVMAGVYMVSQNKDTLEDEDYYERGIQYDEVYQRRQILENRQATPDVQIVQNTLVIDFKETGNAGSVRFRRSSNSALDTEIPFDVAGKSLQLSLDSLAQGAWTIELIWKSNGHAYQFEKKAFWGADGPNIKTN